MYIVLFILSNEFKIKVHETKNDINIMNNDKITLPLICILKGTIADFSFNEFSIQDK